MTEQGIHVLTKLSFLILIFFFVNPIFSPGVLVTRESEGGLVCKAS